MACDGVPTDFIEFDELTGWSARWPDGLLLRLVRVWASRPWPWILRVRRLFTTTWQRFLLSEMSRTELAMRILSAEGKISMGRLKKGDLDTEGWTNLATLQGRIDSAPLFIDDSPI